MKPALATIGGLVADLILPIRELPVRPHEHQFSGERLSVEPGGLGNVLITASRLGMQAVALGWLGTDWYGDQVVDLLGREGVDVSHVQRFDGQSTISTVLVDAAGQHVFLGVMGVHGPERVPESWKPVIANTPWILSDGYVLIGNAEVVLEALALAHHAGGVATAFDPGPLMHQAGHAAVTKVLQTSTVLLLTEHEAAGLVGKDTATTMAQALLAHGPRIVVIKRGAEGALVAAAEDVLSQPAFPIRARDTTGAGDAFDAAFITGLAHGLSTRQAVVLANAVGALAVSKLGTGTCLPTREEVRAYLAAEGLNAGELLPHLSPG